jgi:hypothetical protein
MDRLSDWLHPGSRHNVAMYAYIVGAVFFVGIWAVLFAVLRQSRGPMLWASLAFGHAGPISQYWHLKDYWHPTYALGVKIGNWFFGVEDYLFAFAFSGLCAGLFDHLANRRGMRSPQFNISGFIKAVLLVLGCLVAMGAMAGFFKLNSLHAIVLVFLIGSIALLARRPKWIGPAVQTAFILAGTMWVFYAGLFWRLFPATLHDWWNSPGLSGLSLSGVPVEEVAWAWISGLFVGPMVRFCMD